MCERHLAKGHGNVTVRLLHLQDGTRRGLKANVQSFSSFSVPVAPSTARSDIVARERDGARLDGCQLGGLAFIRRVLAVII
jgi:hypothetical protein